MTILYNSPFRGWVEITEEQKGKLVRHFENCIIAMSGEKKQKHIERKFITK